MIWSPQQQGVFTAFLDSTDNVLVRARAGCIYGNAEIAINRAGKPFTVSLRELVTKFNGKEFPIVRSDGRNSTSRGWDLNVSTFVQQERNSVVRLSRIVNAWASGIKQTYTVTTDSGRIIRATDEHPFLTTGGWRRLDELKSGSIVHVRGKQKLNGRASKKFYPALSGMWYHPFASRSEADSTHRYGSAKVPLHRLVAEAHRNEISLEIFLNRVFNNDAAGLQFLDPVEWSVHHIDRDPTNNSISNLDVLTVTEHKQRHAKEGTDLNVAIKIAYESITSVVPFGKEETFDIEVESEPHNFIANGFVVHNTGKTTTIEEAVKRYLAANPGQAVTVCAFGKDIQLELEKRFTGHAVNVRTLHSLGLAAVKRYWPDVAVKFHTDRENLLAERVCGALAPDDIKKLVAKLTTKGRLCAPHAKNIGDLTSVLYTFECDPDESWEQDGFGVEYVESKALQAMEIAASEKPASIDGNDMLYLPVRNRWLRKSEDMVVVDEAQDMNACQLEIAEGICRGRLIVVGDDRQAIYAFAGANSGSLDRLKTAYNAIEMPLTTTYRCGVAIVAEARSFVPDFKVGPENSAGRVETIFSDRLTAQAGPGDFILSRINAPLVSVAMSLLRSGKRTKIAGRDIGKGLVTLMRKLKATSVLDFLRKIEDWRLREEQRLQSKFKNKENTDTYTARLDAIEDQAEMLKSLTDGARNVEEVVTRIEALFTDDGLGDAGMIVCSSIHKAKGKEANRVFVLRDTLRPGMGIEEDNIAYVAITRAKQVLTYVVERHS